VGAESGLDWESNPASQANFSTPSDLTDEGLSVLERCSTTADQVEATMSAGIPTGRRRYIARSRPQSALGV